MGKKLVKTSKDIVSYVFAGVMADGTICSSVACNYTTNLALVGQLQVDVAMRFQNVNENKSKYEEKEVDYRSI